MSAPAARPRVAISRCLLGERVRYNAELKHFPQLIEFVHQHFELVEVCPEVEIGLGVPRPPVQMVDDGHEIRLLGRDDAELDITRPMQDYCQQRPAQLDSLHGMILKSRSPSCGVTDTPLFDRHGHIIEHGPGLFAAAMLKHDPQLPITDETLLESSEQQASFLQQVLDYQRQHIDHS